MTSLGKAALAAAFLILVGALGHFDAQDADEEHKLYCSMVETWKADTRAGIPAKDRAGWPPYDGECK